MNYLQYKDSPITNMLQKISTVLFIIDFLENSTQKHIIASDQFLDMVRKMLTTLIQQYCGQFLEPLSKLLQVHDLYRLLLHVYDKWLKDQKITQNEYYKVNLQIKIYQEQKQN